MDAYARQRLNDVLGRINQVIDEGDLVSGPKDWAWKACVSPTQVIKTRRVLATGEGNVTLGIAVRLARGLGLSEAWFLLGEGPMMSADAKPGRGNGPADPNLELALRIIQKSGGTPWPSVVTDSLRYIAACGVRKSPENWTAFGRLLAQELAEDPTRPEDVADAPFVHTKPAKTRIEEPSASKVDELAARREKRDRGEK